MTATTHRRGWLMLAALSVVGFAGAQAPLFVPAGETMTKAADAFLNSLTAEQRKLVEMPFDAKERLEWHFIPKDKRKGLELNQIKDHDEQKKRFKALLHASLSEQGATKAVGIMRLEALLKELESGKAKPGPIRDPLRYFVTIFGKPDSKERWGLSIEGHHLSLNYVIDKNEVKAVTPMFFGANPARIMKDYPVGPPKDTRYLDEQEDLAFKLLDSLTERQRREAVINSKAPNDIRAAGEPRSPADKPVGMSAMGMTQPQIATLRSLVKSYADLLPFDVAKEVTNEVERGLFALIRFAWAGSEEPGKGHYYRIEGSNFVIEYCNTQPDSDGNPANHVHAVLRFTKGNYPDFGIGPPEKPGGP